MKFKIDFYLKMIQKNINNKNLREMGDCRHYFKQLQGFKSRLWI